MMKRWTVLILFALGAVLTLAPAEAKEARLDWWREARFGMFIHWGPVSLTGKEISWSRANSNTNSPNQGDTPVEVYDNLYRQFNPTNFNADEWVRIAQEAGMKYMVLTAKHGDGFLLWPSKVDGYNIGATPFHRDICGELAAAAHRRGMRLGWYFSPMDWRDPDCRSTNNDRFVAKIQAELRELLSNYGKIDVLWFDTDGMPTMWDPVGTYALVRKLQPRILINNRLEMSTHEQWVHQGHLGPNEDFYTPEQRIGSYDDQNPWETCMTIGTQWSWKPDDKIKPASEVIRDLARCAGGDGNLLLDVGPMPDGRIEPRQVEVLRQTGTWLARNGSSIYGTRGGPWKPTRTAASTRREDTVYLHVLRPESGALELPVLGPKIKSASILGGGAAQVEQNGDKLEVTIPQAGVETGDTVIQLKLRGSAMRLAAVQSGPEIKAAASNIFQNQDSSYGPQFAFDADSDTRWATDSGTKQAWIAADFGHSRTVDRARIEEAYAPRVQRFELQYRKDGAWKTILSGTTLGAEFERNFAPVTAQEFRLNILDASDAPTISEIEFFGKPMP